LDNGEKIVDKINALPLEDDKKIDFAHIKNVPDFKKSTYHAVSGIKAIIAGTNITVDNTNLGYPVINATGGGGASAWGDITGTLSNQTDLQTALDAKGSGNVSKVGTPTNNQIGVWTGDGTIEGTAGLTYDGSNLQLTGDIGSTGTRITKGWFTDLQATNSISGSITGNAGTVTNGVYTGDAGTVFEVPLTFGDGLTRTGNDIDLDTTVNIQKISGLTSNGFVKTSSGDGTLSVDTNTYQVSDTQLTSLAGLSYTGNALKVIQVNAGETDFELATVSGGLSQPQVMARGLGA
jgi:hypothetical protein